MCWILILVICICCSLLLQKCNCLKCLYAHNSKQITSIQFDDRRENERNIRHHSLQFTVTDCDCVCTLCFEVYCHRLAAVPIQCCDANISVMCISLLHVVLFFFLLFVVVVVMFNAIVKRVRRNEYRRKYKIQLHLFSFHYFTLALFDIFEVLFHFHLVFFLIFITICDLLSVVVYYYI